jgi:aldehyde:ferredoxin oxidoreductase
VKDKPICLGQGQVMAEKKLAAIYVEAHKEPDQDDHKNMGH